MTPETTLGASGSHTFHIPVMGTGFTIDTPLKVARYGISSVVSLVDDVLIERMRGLHCRLMGEEYVAIGKDEEDSRARRITSYLDLLDRRVKEQVGLLKESVFEQGSEITRYFEMLPSCPLKATYRRMLSSRDAGLKQRLQTYLRQAVTPGRIDVNIMTKLDRDNFLRGVKLPSEFSDALAALRGFARSKLRGSVVLSAGLNTRLYSYLSRFDDFFPDEAGQLKKKIILKVSDLRSALVQGRFLARKGLWVSEYRVESGLNCGGHAFPTQGHLLGPILEEFRGRRKQLKAQLFELFSRALQQAGRTGGAVCPEMRLTVQGGIGTHEEHELLLRRFEVDGTGWGTPFLLVPEAVNVDAEHLAKLAAARTGDVYLSESSPLGILFWNLRNSGSEEARRERIARQAPGSSCPKGYLVSDTEFTKVPICTASRAYQRRKLASLEKAGLAPAELAGARESVVGKSCICHDLSGCAPSSQAEKQAPTPAVCSGPNIVNFDRLVSLAEMVEHIYGERSVMQRQGRPHMFIRELSLYVEFLDREFQRSKAGLACRIKSFAEFRVNLLAGIDYYRGLAREGHLGGPGDFQVCLESLAAEVESLIPAEPISV